MICDEYKNQKQAHKFEKKKKSEWNTIKKEIPVVEGKGQRK